MADSSKQIFEFQQSSVSSIRFNSSELTLYREKSDCVQFQHSTFRVVNSEGRKPIVRPEIAYSHHVVAYAEN